VNVSVSLPDKLRQFLSTLQGSFDVEYTVASETNTKLYELGKAKAWNATIDIDWALTRPDEPFDGNEMGFADYRSYRQLSEQQRREFLWQLLAWHASQFLHGEQGALLVASQLVTCAPDISSKMYAASQASDEARHVEVLRAYQARRGLELYPVSLSLGRLLSKILTDERWDFKLIGMQVIIEGIALASLQNIKDRSRDPLFSQIVGYVLKDEARHVSFGVDFLQRHLASLTPQEFEQRAKFCLDACIVMRDRFVPVDLFSRYGWNWSETLKHLSATEYVSTYKDVLFRRIVPVINKLGLITPSTAPHYDTIGALAYKDEELLD
jgi:hypothetical protein